MEALRETSSSYSSYKMPIFVRDYLNYRSVEKAKILKENTWVLISKLSKLTVLIFSNKTVTFFCLKITLFLN